MEVLNNREIAIVAWGLVFALFLLQKADIRKSFANVVRVFCCFQILRLLFLMLIYVAVLVALLAQLGLWKIDLLKDTIVWFVFGAMVLMIRSVRVGDPVKFFRKMLMDNLKVVILLEFIVSKYTFPLVIELVLIPLLAFIVLIDAVAGMNEEHAIVAKIIKRIQVIIGFVIIGHAVYQAIVNYQDFKSLDTARDIALVPLLTALLIPFIYILFIIRQYSEVFLRLNLGAEKSRRLKRYAKRRIIIYAGFRFKRLRYLLKNHTMDIKHAKVKSDIDYILDRARNSDPPII